MKIVLMIIAVAWPGIALAEAPGATAPLKPTIEEGVAAFAVRAPDEGSPFFSQRQAAQYALSESGREQTAEDSVDVFPRVKNSPNSASGMLTGFFTEMFSSIRWETFRSEPTTEKLKLDPEEFSLGDRNEVEAVYSIRNNTKKIIRLKFDTTQHIDMMTMDGSGKVLEQWSNDRSFEPREGLVVINPKERIEYREKIATRDFQGGESYSLKAEVVGYPDYTTVRTVSPSP
jgi:hypothetical protein